MPLTITKRNVTFHTHVTGEEKKGRKITLQAYGDISHSSHREIIIFISPFIDHYNLAVLSQIVAKCACTCIIYCHLLLYYLTLNFTAIRNLF